MEPVEQQFKFRGRRDFFSFLWPSFVLLARSNTVLRSICQVRIMQRLQHMLLVTVKFYTVFLQLAQSVIKTSLGWLNDTVIQPIYRQSFTSILNLFKYNSLWIELSAYTWYVLYSYISSDYNHEMSQPVIMINEQPANSNYGSLCYVCIPIVLPVQQT